MAKGNNDPYGSKKRFGPDPIAIARKRRQDSRAKTLQKRLRRLPFAKVKRTPEPHLFHLNQAKSESAWWAVKTGARDRHPREISEAYPVSETMKRYHRALTALGLDPYKWSWDYARGYARGAYGVLPGESLSDMRIKKRLQLLRGWRERA